MSTTRPALWHGLSPCHNDIPAATAVALADMRAGRGWLPSVVAFGIALGCGLAITLAQLILACLLSDGATLGQAYTNLCRWDGGWYASIVETGYHSPPMLTSKDWGNVAFFPGYPLSALAVQKLTGLRTPHALLLAAQLACWAFWTYLLLLLRRQQVPPRLCLLGVVLILIHPAAFYLVASYSEPLFLTAVLGFLYWADTKQPRAGVLAALHGVLMTGTRLVGLPLVIYPLCHAWLCRETSRRQPTRPMRTYVAAALVGATASLGCLAFFGYCQWRFGAWDQYMKTGHVGWGITPDYLGLFSWRTLHVRVPGFKYLLPEGGEFLSRVAVPAAIALFAALIVAEWKLARSRGDTGWRYRAGLYLCAALMFYVPASAQCTRGMTSMIRYALCVQVLLAMAFVHLLARIGPLNPVAGWRLKLFLSAWCTICFLLQLMFTWRFAHGLWVA
jgi:hypothetical protein